MAQTIGEYLNRPRTLEEASKQYHEGKRRERQQQRELERAARPPVVHTSSTPGTRGDAYALAGINEELARLVRCQELGWGTHWDDTSHAVGCNLIELTNSTWNSYTREWALEQFLAHAPRDGKFEAEKKWTAALNTVGEKTRPAPAGEPSRTTGDLTWTPPTSSERDDAVVEEPPRGRRLVLTSAATIRTKLVRWLLAHRMALGTLQLCAGREGSGKSTLCYTFAADLTRGRLDGEHLGDPRAVLVAATEDSWAHTIVPRLMAADADLALVYRVEVTSSDGLHVGLSLPLDLDEVEAAAGQTGAVLLLLDPLMSRLGSNLDSHKDAEVRRALEPLAAVADRTGMTVLGLIHHNKGSSRNPLDSVMASKAFTAVARGVHTVVADPDDETGRRRLFGTTKSNLGRTDLPVLAFEVATAVVQTDEGPGETSHVVWLGEAPGTIGDAMRRAAEPDDDRSATAEAADWLVGYLEQHGEASRADVLKAAQAARHSEQSVRRARERLGIQHRRLGFPSVTVWSLPTTGARVESSRGDHMTNTTHTTGPDLQERDPSVVSTSVSRVSRVSRQLPQDDDAAPDTTAPVSAR